MSVDGDDDDDECHRVVKESTIDRNRPSFTLSFDGARVKFHSLPTTFRRFVFARFKHAFTFFYPTINITSNIRNTYLSASIDTEDVGKEGRKEGSFFNSISVQTSRSSRGASRTENKTETEKPRKGKRNSLLRFSLSPFT